MKLRSSIFILCALLFLAWSVPAALAAPTIWSGPNITFSKPGFVHHTQSSDRLTNGVILARGNSQGLFNSYAENLFGGSVSPLFTEWATDLNNPGKTIDASNWAALAFTNWTAAYNNAVGTNFDRNAVVHLTQEDIYLNLRFTSWGSSATGGDFSYVRSTPVPEPAAILLALAGLFAPPIRRRHGLK